MENSLKVPQKVKNRTITVLLGIQSKRTKNRVLNRYLFAYLSSQQHYSKCLSTNERIKKKNVVPTQCGIYTAFKRKEILRHATTWMNLEDMLSEISQSQKEKYFLIPLYYMGYLKQSDTQKQKVEWWFPGAGERRELFFNGYRFSVL